MFLFKTVQGLRTYLDEVRSRGETIGFVPTMGALHPGHEALIRHSIAEGHHTVVSIYVNPKQFNDPGDLEKYPRDPGRDLHILNNLGCQVVFLPGDEEVYPAGEDRSVSYLDLGKLGTTLEGAFRPGHFEGMVKVMERLLDIVEPDYLWMGQKDLQQLIIVEKLIRYLALDVKLEGRPIVREESGLALSSRNVRLTEAQKRKAAGIFQVLTEARGQYERESPENIKEKAMETLENRGLRVEYFEFVDGHTLELLTGQNGKTDSVFIVTAVWCDEVRLIDNIRVL